MGPMKIEPIEKVSLVDMAEEKLAALITKRRLRQGDTLPKESDLAESLKVSRSVVREAVSRLRMLGLVECRRRRGTVVAKPDILAGMKRLMTCAGMDEKTAREIFEMRLSLEIGVADILFIRKTDKDIADLEAIVKREEESPPGAFRDFDCEILFHGRIFAIVGNEFMARLQEVLTSFFSVVRNWKTPSGDPWVANKPWHRDILTVLAKGTAKEYRDVMSRHFAVYFDAMQKESLLRKAAQVER